MINRLFQLARSNIGYFFNKKHSEFNGPPITDNSDRDQINNNTRYESVDNPLEKYFSNLELPTTASRKEVKNAWRHLMKKYHPDLLVHMIGDGSRLDFYRKMASDLKVDRKVVFYGWLDSVDICQLTTTCWGGGEGVRGRRGTKAVTRGSAGLEDNL